MINGWIICIFEDIKSYFRCQVLDVRVPIKSLAFNNDNNQF